MKNIPAFFVFALLLLLVMGCQFITGTSPVQVTPSSPGQTPPTASALPPTAAPSPTDELVPSPVPPTATQATVVSDLTDTHWMGSIYDENNPSKWEVFEIYFLPGGKMRYYVPNAWYEDGTWQQKGDDITLVWGDHDCDFYGVLYDDTILGARKCTDGKTWGWSVKLQAP
jgi:hypothetical protein